MRRSSHDGNLHISRKLARFSASWHLPTRCHQDGIYAIGNVNLISEQAAWRMRTPLTADLQNSDQNGGCVFLIFVADPRIARLFRYLTARQGGGGVPGDVGRRFVLRVRVLPPIGVMVQRPQPVGMALL